MRPSRPIAMRLIMALAAIGLFLIGYQWGNQYQRASDGRLNVDAVVIRPPTPLPQIQLRTPEGAIDTGDLGSNWSLIAFGSAASAAGHRGVARLIEVSNRLADEPELRRQLRLLLVSGDDTPGLARDFERLAPNLSVATSSLDGLATLKAALGVDAETAYEGDLDAPPPLFLVDPESRLVALFAATQPAASVASDFKAFSEQAHALDSTREISDD